MMDTKGQRNDESPADRAWGEFVEFLKRRGARITHSRRIVFERVLGYRKHFRADDLAAELVAGPDRVSRGTVYRTLGLMVEAGYARKVRDDDRHSHYEPSYGREQHEHMICRDCGKIIEFEDAQIEQWLLLKCRELHFEPLRHRVTVIGRCEGCTGSADRGGAPEEREVGAAAD